MGVVVTSIAPNGPDEKVSIPLYITADTHHRRDNWQLVIVLFLLMDKKFLEENMKR